MRIGKEEVGRTEDERLLSGRFELCKFRFERFPPKRPVVLLTRFDSVKAETKNKRRLRSQRVCLRRGEHDKLRGRGVGVEAKEAFASGDTGDECRLGSRTLWVAVCQNGRSGGKKRENALG
jgi:hypothetical protein